MKNKSVQNCRFFHDTKFHCIMKTLNRLLKIEFERGGTGKEPIHFLYEKMPVIYFPYHGNCINHFLKEKKTICSEKKKKLS